MLTASIEHAPIVEDPVGDPYARMLDVLSWEPHDAFLDALIQGHVDRLSQALGGALARASATSSASETRRLNGLFDRLDDHAAVRMMTAPETYDRLIFNPADGSAAAAFLQSTMTAELGLAGAAEAWTALGDRCVAPRSSQGRGAVGNDLRSHRVGFNGIPVDANSPWARDLNSVDSPFEPYAPDALEDVIHDLDAAARAVAVTDLSAAYLLFRFTRVIVVRKDPMAPTDWGSSSTHSHVGRTVLINPHLVDVGVLTNALVHESIHAALYIVEQSHPMVHNEALARDQWQNSPWSGNPLRLRTYIHACLVWYGLANFWRRALERQSFPSSVAQDHLTRALKGFGPEEPVLRLMAVRDNVTPPAAAALSRLGARLNDMAA